MKTVRTLKERELELAAHPGESHYKIFYKDERGQRVRVSDFWAPSEDAALAELENYRKRRAEEDPSDGKEYFFGRIGNYVSMLGNGLVVERDEFKLSDEDGEDDVKETFFEKASSFFRRASGFLHEAKNVAADFAFLLKNYDFDRRLTHSRSESWNLDTHILNDIEFNVPRMKESRSGIPNEFAEKAGEILSGREAAEGKKFSADEKLDLGEKLWNEELDRLLLAVRLYRYYSELRCFDERDPVYVEIDKEYGKTIPYFPGRDGEIDYEKLSELTQTEWRKIWAWMEKYGQMLWT